MGNRKVKLTFILIENYGIYSLPFLLHGPFTVMMENRIPTRQLSTEKMAYRQQTSLAAALKLVDYCICNLHKIEFRSETSFCSRKIGHNFRLYCIFVKYGVFWYWYDILKFEDNNIVRSLQNTLYFNYFTALLTSIN